jgi:hypothetical protein
MSIYTVQKFILCFNLFVELSGCSTPRLLATESLEEISSISWFAEGMVVKNSEHAI